MQLHLEQNIKLLLIILQTSSRLKESYVSKMNALWRGLDHGVSWVQAGTEGFYVAKCQVAYIKTMVFKPQLKQRVPHHMKQWLKVPGINWWARVATAVMDKSFVVIAR